MRVRHGDPFHVTSSDVVGRLKFSGAIVTSGTTATTSYLADCGAQLQVSNLGPQRYPTSRMKVEVLRVTKGNGSVLNDIMCTLYRNGSATSMQVTILAADPANTKYVDGDHPVTFDDGDDYDLRLDDDSADVLHGTLPVAAQLEYSLVP